MSQPVDREGNEIVVGAEGFMSCWTDRVPMRVIETPTPLIVAARRIEVRYDANGYEVPGSRGELTGVVHYFTQRKDGSFTERGSKMGDGWRFSLGEHGYYDRSF